MPVTTQLTDDTRDRIMKAKEVLYSKYGIEMSVTNVLSRIVPGPEDIIKNVLESINIEFKNIQEK
jgi:hypothetical protein